jgi:hypothetical protein
VRGVAWRGVVCWQATHGADIYASSSPTVSDAALLPLCEYTHLSASYNASVYPHNLKPPLCLPVSQGPARGTGSWYGAMTMVGVLLLLLVSAGAYRSAHLGAHPHPQPPPGQRDHALAHARPDFGGSGQQAGVGQEAGSGHRARGRRR